MAGMIPRTPVSELKSRDPVRVKTNTPLLDVVMAMKQGRRGSAIIEDNDGKLAGIVTERDLIGGLDHSTFDWHDTPVDRIMTRDPISININQYLHEALWIMVTSKFRRLPIVDSDNHVTGIVSIRDIIMYVASLYPQKFLNLPPDPDHEASGQYGG